MKRTLLVILSLLICNCLLAQVKFVDLIDSLVVQKLTINFDDIKVFDKSNAQDINLYTINNHFRIGNDFYLLMNNTDNLAVFFVLRNSAVEELCFGETISSSECTSLLVDKKRLKCFRITFLTDETNMIIITIGIDQFDVALANNYISKLSRIVELDTNNDYLPLIDINVQSKESYLYRYDENYCYRKMLAESNKYFDIHNIFYYDIFKVNSILKDVLTNNYYERKCRIKKIVPLYPIIDCSSNLHKTNNSFDHQLFKNKE